MAVQALVIAIENYPLAGAGISQSLSGTHASARRFCDWLLKSKEIAVENLLVCSDATNLPGKAMGVVADDLRQAIAEVVSAGKDRCEELYVFFSGHGLSYTDSLSGLERPTDVLVAADFRNLADSGNECLRLNEIQNKLRLAMGPGEHYYFIDACRNTIKASEVDPGRLGKTFSSSKLGHPVLYTLYSTGRGAVAAVASGFGSHLASGLKGAGKAKVWRSNGGLAVLFDSLKRYVRLQLQPMLQQVDSQVEGDGDGVILEIVPPPKYTCTIQVESAGHQDSFSYTLWNSRQQEIGSGEFQGSEFSLTQLPDDYYVKVSFQGRALLARDSLPVDLYQDRTLSFDKEIFAAEEPILLDPAMISSVQLHVPAETVVTMEDLQLGGLEERYTNDENVLTWDMPAGDYRFELSEPGLPSLRHREVSLAPGQQRSISLRRRGWRKSAQVLGREFEVDPGRVAFSKTVGPMVDTDLGLWLSLLGASRIVGGGNEKLRELPLESFSSSVPGTSPLYVLAALKGVSGRLRLGLSRDRAPSWQWARRVEGIPGLYQLRLEAEPGGHLLSIRKQNTAPFTLVTHSMPNRATLVVLTDGDWGGLSIRQFLLPIANLVSYLAPEVAERLPKKPLEAVRFMAEAQRLFAAKRSLIPTEEYRRWGNYWEDLLYQKWLDPVMSILASYELLRRGQPGSIPEVVGNLRRYFPGLPDTEVLARFGGEEEKETLGVPLVLEGFLASKESSFALPLPIEKIDYTGPWTAWLGAVHTG